MGMFDYIKCEVDLPNQHPQNKEEKFQTKAFGNLMETYVISHNGEIYKEHWDMVWEENSLSVFGGIFKQVPESFRREYLTDYHGDVIFHNSRPLDNGKYKWVEYTARFTNGKLASIKSKQTDI